MDPPKQPISKIRNNNNTLVTHQDKCGQNEVLHYRSSCFIKPKGVFAKGEFSNPHASKRNASILLFKQGSDKIIGNYFYLFKLLSFMFSKSFK